MWLNDDGNSINILYDSLFSSFSLISQSFPSHCIPQFFRARGQAMQASEQEALE